MTTVPEPADIAQVKRVPSVSVRVESRIRGRLGSIGLKEVERGLRDVAGIGPNTTVVADLGNAEIVSWTAAEALAGRLADAGQIEIRGTSTAAPQLATYLEIILSSRSFQNRRPA